MDKINCIVVTFTPFTIFMFEVKLFHLENFYFNLELHISDIQTIMIGKWATLQNIDEQKYSKTGIIYSIIICFNKIIAVSLL